MKNRKAFTIVELMVSLAVIGLLVALLLPAIQSARESSRSIDCRNRLKQIGLGLHGYESRNSHLPMEGGPPGTQVPGTQRRANGLFSVQAQLLDDLEQSALARKIDLSVMLTGGGHNEQPLELYRCPSQPDDVRGINYRFCEGTLFHGSANAQSGRGMFLGATLTSSRDILDGLSNTVAASERIRSDDSPASYDHVEDILGTGATAVIGNQPRTPELVFSICESMQGSPAVGYSGQVGWYWYRGSSIQTLYNHIAPPNSNVTDCVLGDLTTTSGLGMASHSNEAGQVSARSLHPGGVHCLYADGSVHFISNSIDLKVWRSSATIADADVP